jgi:RHS repeat-associated protein
MKLIRTFFIHEYVSIILSSLIKNLMDYISRLLSFIPIAAGFAYDYFIKDHLGNVRMLLTDEQQIDKYPVASLEPAKIATEKNYYDINDAQVVDKSIATGITDYTNDNGIGNNPGDPPFETANSTKLYKLNSNEAKTGLGITLRVMAGDKIDVLGKSYYFQNSPGSSSNNNIPITDILSAFLNAPAAAAVTSVHGAVTPALINTPTGIAGITNMMNNQADQNNAAPLKPKAFINVIFFDEQFKTVDYRVSMVGNNSTIKDHYAELQNIAVPKNGFVYIYCSNESPVNVFFDNLQVVHTRGPILEETHYYPFGLTMAGISSKAANTIPNKENTFQEQRFDDDLGINYIQFKYRSHDPQIGRFIQIDPLSHNYRYNSTYAFSENRVTDGRELEGLEYVSIHHYANGTVGTKMFYKSTDEEINQRGGTTAGLYNSASYGPLGKGVVHYYYDSKGALLPKETKWDQQQTGGGSDFKFHGLYSGPGSITKDGGEKSTNYDFSFQPIDWADAIAKRHDMDYAAATATGEAYAGFLEDVRTVQADKDMVQRLKDYTNPFKDITGVETPFRTSYSVEMDGTMVGQSIVIGALATYKQWKIDNGYGNKDTYDKLRAQFVEDNPGTTDIIDLLIK